jgi:hypothetical protein
MLKTISSKFKGLLYAVALLSFLTAFSANVKAAEILPPAPPKVLLPGQTAAIDLRFPMQPAYEESYLMFRVKGGLAIDAVTKPVISFKGSAKTTVLRVPGFAGQCREFSKDGYSCIEKEKIGLITSGIFIVNTKAQAGSFLAFTTVTYDTSAEVSLEPYKISYYDPNSKPYGNLASCVSGQFNCINLTKAGLLGLITEAPSIWALPLYYVIEPSAFKMSNPGILAVAPFSSLRINLKDVVKQDVEFRDGKIGDIYLRLPKVQRAIIEIWPRPQLDPVMYWFNYKGKVYNFLQKD